MNEKRIYLIQEIESGVPEPPMIYLNEKDADKAYIELINKKHGKTFKTVKQATKFLNDEGNEGDGTIHYWVSVPL